MKLSQISCAAVLAFTTFAQGAAILPRQDVANDGNTTGSDNSTASQYPNMPDLGNSNGTWFLTAITTNAFDAYTKIAEKLNISANCINFNVSASSNTSFDLLGSGMLENNVTQAAVNGTIAGVFMLESPDDKVNVSDNEFYWKAYFSEIYVNTAAWQNFTTGQENSTSEGSEAVPGTGPIQASVYSKFIDSSGNNNTANADTLLVWGSEYQKLSNDNNSGDDETTLTRRADDNKTIYAILLSRTSHVDDETFNKTLGYMPSQFTKNNVTLVNLNDTCSSVDSNSDEQQ
ncbi:hypothetical protein K501DRAFT_254410 [Backusella circina FSU 941]|nr:hypothetical protein K501DRAFT_254410 [Backusella circina FSU 941]